MSEICFKYISKSFDEITVLKDINIEVKSGELFTFLGPSGCGKTTLLRILAGFEKPDSGTVEINNEDITNLIPEKRSISMVFQNYALFPHMNVFENVGYGLRIQGVNDKKVKSKVAYLLKMLRLESFHQRDINELSGGEQQRVAIARALAVDPKVLLLDEPLSNLDAKLRDETRVELRVLQNNLGISTIFVTHDQQEAMSISDRVAVFNEGRVMQTGSPEDIYNYPENEFVATFIGESNLIDKEFFASFALGQIKAEKVCIRPQDIKICDNGEFLGKIVNIDFKGSSVNYHCNVDQVAVKVMQVNSGTINIFKPGELVKLSIDKKAIKKLR